jgi:hypothetical protein
MTGIIVPVGVRENSLRRNAGMAMKKHKPEQIVALLRQIEVVIANGNIRQLREESAGPARNCRQFCNRQST